MSQPFYITTPIYYVNAEPHLGHAYTTIVADVASRYHRLAGDEVRFQTGTDEHGDKIAQAAEERGVTPQQYADQISGKFRHLWPELHITNDKFIRTTDADHKQVVTSILQKVYDAGDIYFAKYGGHYCVGCERFLTEHEMIDGKCPDHGTVPVYQEEENYFFRMSNYTEQLKAHIEAHPDFIRPERYKNEVLSMLEQGLEDLCISRPKTRLTWGIDLPFDTGYVTYVWFDALINYLTGLGWPDGGNMAKFWPGAQHLIAKDILKPHAIFWPTMLMSLARAEGRPAHDYLYQHLNVHGYWNVDQAKMSKSLGNVVRPLELAEIYGVEAFRYFLMREMSFGLDSSFSEQLLVERYNSDLANDLGNLFSRVLSLLHKFRGGVVPQPGPEQPQDAELAALSDAVLAEYRRENQRFAFHKALASVWSLIGAANKYVVVSEPWTLAKDPEQAPRLDRVLHDLCQLLAKVAVMIRPVMPLTAEKMAGVLSLGRIEPGMLALLEKGQALLAPGAQTHQPPALFPRIDTKKVKAKAAKAGQKAEAKPAPKAEKKAKAPAPSPEKAAGEPAQISIEQFGQVKLKVATVLTAERIPKADKILKLTLDAGEDQPRTVVAGVAQHYEPEELVGMQVVIVANLKPAKLRGITSQGMVLAAVGPDGLCVVSPSKQTPPGSQVR
ncbi:MAG: methionine--tRNA ligase [Desulfarculaceae bacterium]|nr:methionine--tRNA ligase [Desulfarculaceae bacterium]MCF8047321.1 methionine--tRNA ligase [Desulfarculaceae bacterium]MCF8096624.1 methionine--tRNA ligase [Desulfarculaceae bacterium]MCF8122282.1 methionine--tRNA ligase [Desulfarculaceae bacterium]